MCSAKAKAQPQSHAPEITIAQGTAVLIKGTVMDQSPAQPNTPCVSKDSMSLQMEHIHMAMPIAGLWGNETITGVPVTLTAIAADGSVTDIGTATTNGYYGNFAYTWTPPKEASTPSWLHSQATTHTAAQQQQQHSQ